MIDKIGNQINVGDHVLVMFKSGWTTALEVGVVHRITAKRVQVMGGGLKYKQVKHDPDVRLTYRNPDKLIVLGDEFFSNRTFEKAQP